MRISLNYGRQHLDLNIADDRLLPLRRQPIAPPLTDPAAALREALEHPHGFPALRRALTPDDHVAVIVDEDLPNLAGLLTVLLEHLAQALIAPEDVTILSARSANQAWVDALPDAWQDVHVEGHDARDRRRLSYLATTKQGRRVYLNRTVVDADQVVVLTRRRFDSSAETDIFPSLSDEATLKEPIAPEKLRQEAVEIAWLLGAPFFVQVIEGADDAIAHIVAGPIDSGSEAQRLLDARWQVSLPEQAETVIATVSGDPARHDFATLTQALSNAAHLVEDNGRIVLLTDAVLKPDDALTPIWREITERARVYVLLRDGDAVAEEMDATPITPAEVQRLIDTGGPCVILEDAHKVQPAVRG
jgi:nickel-dependent lactate racemase